MPLNSFTCENCGARNNYIVETDANGEQTVACHSCGTAYVMEYDDLPDRVKNTLTDLQEDSKIFTDDTMSVIDDPNSVDDTLDQVDMRFQEARKVMDSFNDVVKIKDSLLKSADELSDGALADAVEATAETLVQQRDSEAELDLVLAVIEKTLSASQLGNKQLTKRLLSYFKQVAHKNYSLEEALRPDFMEASGLKPQEQFIIAQLAKNNFVRDKLQSVLK